MVEDFLWDDGGSMCAQVKIPPLWGLFFETANTSCHDPWWVVSHVTPIMLLWRILDPYWVTLWKLLMWLPQAMYIVSHTKGLPRYFTSFFYRPSLLLNTTFSTSFVSLGPTGAWPLPCMAAFPHSIGFLQLLYYLLQHSPCTPIPGAPGTSW